MTIILYIISILIMTLWVYKGSKDFCNFTKADFKYKPYEPIIALISLILLMYLPGVSNTGEFKLFMLPWCAFLVGMAWIDFRHQIIPDLMNVFGFLAAAFALYHIKQGSPKFTFEISGVITGVLAIYGIIELGKKMFGKYTEVFEKGEIVERTFEDNKFWWTFKGEKCEERELFYRESDKMFIDGDFGKIECSRKEFKLNGIVKELYVFKGNATKIEIPREAMGLGDLKLMPALCLFTDWLGVVNSLAIASILGAIVGSILKYFTKETKIAFGPFLGIGFYIWTVYGIEIINYIYGDIPL